MSRFFAVGNESDSDSESEEVVPVVKAPITYQHSDGEEDCKRLVKPEKEKRYEQYQRVIKQSKNYKKIKDMIRLLAAFEDLIRVYSRTASNVGKSIATPIFFIKWIIEMEDFVDFLWREKEERKTISKNNFKSLVALRKKLKKFSKELEGEIKMVKENPELSDDIDEEIAVQETADDSDSIDWDSDEESDDESVGNQFTGYMSLRDRFLKKNVEREEKKTEKEKKDKKLRTKGEEEDNGDWETVQFGGRPLLEKTLFAAGVEITSELVMRKLTELTNVRGKKRSDRREIIELLQELQNIIETANLPAIIAIHCKLAVITAMLDYNPNFLEAMKWEHWNKLIKRIYDLADLLKLENCSDDKWVIDWGSVVSISERLNEEFYKLLKVTDPHGDEYVGKLKFEANLVQIIDKLVAIVEKKGSVDECCRIFQTKIEHLYYKYKSSPDAEEEIVRLFQYIYDNDTTARLRITAILCLIYFYAIHTEWHKARDLMLMSHLQEVIHYADPNSQILYNRTMAQLGLAAFRTGHFNEAHQCLSELLGTGRVKELLGQGLLPQWRVERTQEQMKKEFQRQIPFHMQLNLDLLECVYLISAMIVDVPSLAILENSTHRFTISKAFYILLRSMEKLPLQGPPENAKEHVVAAARALKCGQYQQCLSYLFNPKMDNKIWCLLHDAKKIKGLLTSRLQKECFRCYIFSYSSVYRTISCGFLAKMFDLTERDVRATIGQMIISDNLQITIDDTTKSIIILQEPAASLQLLALQLVEKFCINIDNNERISDLFKKGLTKGGQRCKF